MRRQFETNVFGLTQLTKLVLPGMRKQGWGKIVNLSSMGGRMTLPGGGFYHATKYAVEAISDALRFEVRASASTSSSSSRARSRPSSATPRSRASRRSAGRTRPTRSS